MAKPSPSKYKHLYRSLLHPENDRITIRIQFERILNERCETINTFTHVCLTADDVDVLHARKILFHPFSSFIMVWIMRSSTPLKKEISATAVLITQLGSAVY